MQTWDYCTFWCDEIAEYGYITKMDGSSPASTDVQPADREDFLKFKVRILSILGADGWELVSVVNTPPHVKTLYFKRPAGASAAVK